MVWRLDRWGRSLVDLVNTLQELSSLKVGFVSLNEALDLTTPRGRALAGMLAVFAEFEKDILRDRVKAGIAQARKEGRPHGRPPSDALHIKEINALFRKGLSKREIANRPSYFAANFGVDAGEFRLLSTAALLKGGQVKTLALVYVIDVWHAAADERCCLRFCGQAQALSGDAGR